MCNYFARSIPSACVFMRTKVNGLKKKKEREKGQNRNHSQDQTTLYVRRLLAAPHGAMAAHTAV